MPKEYRNPMPRHFAYCMKSRKFICKKCFFVLDGLHSANLMFHLRHNHADTYDALVDEKIRMNKLRFQESKDVHGLGSRCFSPKIFLGTKKPSDLQKSGNNKDNVPGTQFAGVSIVKAEKSKPKDKDCEDLVAETPNTTTGAAMMQPPINSSTSVTNVAPPAPPPVPVSATIPTQLSDAGLPSKEDSLYVQYLAHKLSQYSPHTKHTVQYQINKILYKADMGSFEEIDPKIDDESDS